MNTIWHKFATCPQYNYKSTTSKFLEDDADLVYILYRYSNRIDQDDSENNDIFISLKPTRFVDGYFEDFKSHMITSPYSTDWIDVIAWCYASDVAKALKKSFTR